MYEINRNVLFRALLIVAPLWVESKSFNVKISNVCLPNTSGMRTFAGISLEGCIFECGKRSNCEYIVYQRRFGKCQLFGDLDSATFLQKGKGCVMIKRKDMDTSSLTNQCVCDEGQVCNNGACENEECTPPTISNGGLIGNIYAVGSSLKVICEHNYTELNSLSVTTCEVTGSWSYNPFCVSTIVCVDMQFANGELKSSGNGVGATRTIVCHAGYEEEQGRTEVQCASSGNWNFVPVCNRICVDMQFANGELKGSGNGVGATRTIVCHDGYEEEQGRTEVQCASSGNWNFVPVCNRMCPSDSGHSGSAFHIRVFHIKSDRKSRDDAIDYCIADGGTLVKINETWKMDFVADILKNCKTYSKHEYWTDGKGNNVAWLFSDNTYVPMTSHFWRDGKPAHQKDCARIKEHNGKYLWDDRRCRDDLGFICEY